MNTIVKIGIIVLVTLCIIGLFVWWLYRPETIPTTSNTVSQRLLVEGDKQLAQAERYPEDPYYIQRAVESYAEAGYNGDEEGALSLARVFLHDENYYNPQQAHQIVTLTLENTQSAIIAQRCFELLDEIKTHIEYLPEYNIPRQQPDSQPQHTNPQPQSQYTKTQNSDPLHISLTADYTRNQPLRPTESIPMVDYSVDSIQNIVKVPGKSNQNQSQPKNNKNQYKKFQYPTNNNDAKNITVNGKNAQIIENHGSRVLMLDDEPILLPQDFDVQLIEENIMNLMANVITHMQPPKTKLPERMKVRNDSQNVHDSKVVAAAREIYQEISKLPNIKRFEQCEREITNEIKDQAILNTVNKVIRSIKTIENHLALDANGRQVFSTVWSKISNQPEGEKRKNDIDNFILELTHCVTEDGHMLCSTGILNRMLCVFEGTGEYEKAKMVPDSFYNQEMYAAAGKLQEKLEKDGLDFDLKADQEKFKTQFKEEMRKTYVEPGNLTQTELDAKLVWLNDMF